MITTRDKSGGKKEYVIPLRAVNCGIREHNRAKSYKSHIQVFRTFWRQLISHISRQGEKSWSIETEVTFAVCAVLSCCTAKCELCFLARIVFVQAVYAMYVYYLENTSIVKG